MLILGFVPSLLNSKQGKLLDGYCSGKAKGEGPGVKGTGEVPPEGLLRTTVQSPNAVARTRWAVSPRLQTEMEREREVSGSPEMRLKRESKAGFAEGQSENSRMLRPQPLPLVAHCCILSEWVPCNQGLCILSQIASRPHWTTPGTAVPYQGGGELGRSNRYSKLTYCLILHPTTQT